MPEYLYGHWSVMEALRANRRQFEQLLLAEKADEKGSVGEIMHIANVRNVPIKRVPKHILDDLSGGSNHQSTILRTQGYHYAQIDEILDVAQKRNEKPFVLLLDLLKDPQNVGSLLRVADAVGVHGIIMQDRRAVAVTPAVVSASSGAVEHLLVAQVTNLVNTMKDLKKYDIWMVGFEIGEGLLPLNKTNLNMGLGVVLGSEGEGMRRLVKETCDILLTLPMRGNVGSLNVATVGAVALYNAWQAREWQGWKPL
ncbi:MAG: 23S rRNA (guanosine(2251)-2'-O)-methyltransferase RlmB [bacterium]|jgi:23S rRNA (guanosine2251-2'-O)-methyltransferase|nr:23S rRNA (guanosine(2251)-2'-O)-methyltransferase RlmB [bacterium]HRF94158.1 23S rRNA (guanosine(2251)-2'-O)-methyltransferase RlmB [Aggregatilineales bacterium]